MVNVFRRVERAAAEPEGIGSLRERLVIQENAPDLISVTSLTRTSTLATATTATPHGYSSNDYVSIAGATPTGFNGTVKIIVTGASSFTYPVPGTLATPATGAITVLYRSDAQGGRKIGWAPFATVWAELLPVHATERLQAQAISEHLDYRFRIRTRADLTPEMRLLWTPQWPPGAPLHTLEIHGILPAGDGRTFLLLEAGELR